MKYRIGFRYVRYCTATGMLRIGNAKPLSMNAGVEKKKLAIIACCCVREIVERKRPAPNVVIRNNTAQNSSSRKLPCSGMWNTRNASTVTSTTSSRPTTANGSVFPSISSMGRTGVTINCSIVPISFSRTMPSAVNINVTVMMMLAITPGTK